MARTTHVPVVTAGLLAAVIPFSINRAFATDDCLAQPNRQTAPGEHWYYRSDPANDRKCWHIVESGTKMSQEAPRALPPDPTLPQVQQLPSIQPEQSNEQHERPPDQTERGAFEE
jgi:hypothetical protein